MRITNDVDSVTHAFEYAEDFFSGAGLNDSDDVLFNTHIVLDEIISNIVKYANTKDDISVELSVENGLLKIVLIDCGDEFDPIAVANTERRKIKSIEGCQVGGVGLRIVKKISQKMEYERKDGKNTLTVWLSLKHTDA